jgi:hypothetical protein
MPQSADGSDPPNKTTVAKRLKDVLSTGIARRTPSVMKLAVYSANMVPVGPVKWATWSFTMFRRVTDVPTALSESDCTAYSLVPS